MQQLYHETHGDGAGAPLVLLHGGVGASEMFGPNLAALARGRRVLAVHLQGHGRSPDSERPLRYESMADDIAALAAQQGLAQIDLLGYSLGGGVALQTAVRHPRLVRRLALVSTAMRHSGWFPEVRQAFAGMTAGAALVAANLRQSPLAQLHPLVDWERLLGKLGALLAQDYDWSDGVAALETPTMLVFADADSITPEHMVEFYRLLGGGQRDAGLDGALRPAARLAVVPGATHYNILSTSLVAELVAPFLDAP